MIRPVARRRTARLSVEVAPQELIAAITAGKVSAASVSAQEERAIRIWCRERARVSAATIQQLVNRGHHKNAHREARAHMARTEVRLEALFSAARKRWPTRTWMSPEWAEQRRKRRLEQVFVQLPKVGKLGTPAKARRYFVRKSNGGTRPITSFYWVDLARQRLLKSALQPFANFHDGQFMLTRDPRRRGPAAVREALLAVLIECSDESLFLHFDVRDFYGAISHVWLERNLGIDPSIIHRHIHTGGMKIVSDAMATVRDDHEAAREKGRWGIPQGSALSPLIAEQVMSSVLQSAAALDGVPVFAWSDNLGIIVPRQRAKVIESLIREAFASHGAGPFQLTLTEHPITSTFKFLGTWYRKTPSGPEAFIPAQVMSNWQLSVGSRLQLCRDDEIPEIELHVAGKAAQWDWFGPFNATHLAVRHMIAVRRASGYGCAAQ